MKKLWIYLKYLWLNLKYRLEHSPFSHVLV